MIIKEYRFNLSSAEIGDLIPLSISQPDELDIAPGVSYNRRDTFLILASLKIGLMLETVSGIQLNRNIYSLDLSEEMLVRNTIMNFNSPNITTWSNRIKEQVVENNITYQPAQFSCVLGGAVLTLKVGYINKD